MKHLVISILLFHLVFTCDCLGMSHQDRKRVLLPIRIEGRISQLLPKSDTVCIRLWKHTFGTLASLHVPFPYENYKVPIHNGRFTFSTNINDVVFLQIGFDGVYVDRATNQRMFIPFSPRMKALIPAEPGDNVSVNVGMDTVVFSGHGSSKYTLSYLIEKVSNDPVIFDRIGNKIKKSLPFSIGQPWEAKSWLDEKNNTLFKKMVLDSIRKVQLGLLAHYEPELTANIYRMLWGDIEASFREATLHQFFSGKTRQAIENNDVAKEDIGQFYNNGIQMSDAFPSNGIRLSNGYISYILFKYYVEHFLFSEKSDVLARIQSNYTGEMRDILMTGYLKTRFGELVKGDEKIAEAINVIDARYCKEILSDLLIANRKGAPAYPFDLEDENGNRVKLSDLKGKIVMMDFYFNGCSGCVHFYQDKLSKAETFFEGNPNIIFVTVNVDKDSKRWKAALHGGIYTSSGKKNVKNLYVGEMGYDDPMVVHYNARSMPHPVIIDRKGRILETSQGLLLGLTPDQLAEKLQQYIVNGE